jgi:hypothetical protein
LRQRCEWPAVHYPRRLVWIWETRSCILPAEDKAALTFGDASADFLSNSTISVSPPTLSGSGAGGGTGTLPPESVSLSGTVSIGADQVLNVRVALYRDGNLVSQTLTDKNGNYAFFFLSHGTYTHVFAARDAQSQTIVKTI